ncbi:isoprenylcysteine carboxylmethyltransferase family protein [Candidatus Falkowbacteria bacterium]|nr:isoprenylcysteine carboxylmethyltransferase family protein [Candidatus Falkowbacteria bacterium]
MRFDFQTSFSTPEHIVLFASNLAVIFCAFAVFISVLIDFVEFQKRESTKKEKKSIVETGTMFLFFFLFYSLIRFKAGQLDIEASAIKMFSEMLGAIILLTGCFVNIKGRLDLGKNWANQIKIYKDHSFIFSGVYGLVRHPLYASIIWMFFGASLVYLNYASLLANILIFIPFMRYRAKQEESLLASEFKEYEKYQKRVGMFFPKLFQTNK